MPIPKQVLPKEGCLLLCATDEVSGEQLQIRVKANRINLVRGAELLESEDCQFNLKPEDLGLSKVELGDIAGVIWLDTETSLGTLKNLKQWLLKGRNALAGLEDDEKQDLRRLAGNLEIANLRQQLLNKKAKTVADLDVLDSAAAARVLSADLSAVDAPDPETLVTEKVARELDAELDSYTAGLENIVKGYTRPLSRVNLAELQLYCKPHGINLHVPKKTESKQVFMKRYFGSFISAADATEHFTVESGQRLEAGKEVPQTLLGMRKWWPYVEKHGVVHLEPQITSQTAGVQYRSTFRSIEGSSQPSITLSGSPDSILLGRRRNSDGEWLPPAIYEDEGHREKKKDGSLTNWKTLLNREEMRQALANSPINFEAKPTESPLAAARIFAGTMSSNAFASRPVIFVRADFNREYDICIPEDCHLMLYRQLPEEVATPFIIKWLKTPQHELPLRCTLGCLHICGALTALDPYAKDSPQATQSKALSEYLR